MHAELGSLREKEEQSTVRRFGSVAWSLLAWRKGTTNFDAKMVFENGHFGSRVVCLILCPDPPTLSFLKTPSGTKTHQILDMAPPLRTS